MRIAINCRSFLKKQYTGIGRYTYNLVTSLSQIDSLNHYYLYVRKNLFDFKRSLPNIRTKNFRIKVDWLNRGVTQTVGKIDIYHAPSPEAIAVEDVKVVVTIHDLVYKMYPQGHTPDTIKRTEEQLHAIAERSAKIICTSKSTRNDLLENFAVHPSRVCVIYHGVDTKVFYRLSEKEYEEAKKILEQKNIPQPFLLFVGTNEPRKNLNNTIKAYAILKEKKRFPGQLVVAGMEGWMNEEVFDLVLKLGLKEDVIFLGYVNDGELRALYNLTEVFIFPSFYEGFGFPIVEAFSCGAVVVTSQTSSCTEIAGEAAMKIDPRSPEAIAEAVGNIISDKTLKDFLREQGRQRAQHFSFIKTAQETLEVYKEVYLKIFDA